jgi:hypothetical protein
MANRKKKNTTLVTNHSTPSGRPGIGLSQPPKNRIVVSAHISTMFMYSPIMNSRYDSTW